MSRLLAALVAVLTAAYVLAAPAVPAHAATSNGLVGVDPARVLDTRYGIAATRGPAAAGSTLTVQLTGRGGVPASGVAAVVVNLTVSAPADGGWVTAFATGTTRPGSSNLNYARGQTVANQAIVAVGIGGRINLFTQSSAQLIVDVTAYYPTGASFRPVGPARLLDTRGGAPPAAGSITTVPVTGRSGVPSTGVGAVVLNVTAVGAQGSGFLLTWPAGVARPTGSTLNYTRGSTVAAMTIAKVGTGGRVSVYSQQAAHLLVDIVGWLPTTGDFHPVATRLVDTRSGLGAPRARIAAGSAVQVQVAGLAGVPLTAGTDVELTLTAVLPTSPGWMVAYPAGSPRPSTSVLNYTSGASRANSVTMRVGSGGRITIFSTGTTDLIVDLVGYFSDGTAATTGWRQVSAGGGFSCGVTIAGGAWCWGANAGGQLGDGTRADSAVPVPVAGLGSGVRSISAGWYHTCAVLTSGAAVCWGANDNGNLGNGTLTASSVPVPVSGLGSGVADISAAGWHTCAALTSGAARCWGYNPYGELGNGTTADSTVPVPVSGLSTVASISSGWDQTCAVLTSGAARCWGNNGEGELGNGTTTGSTTPVAVSGLSSAVAVISTGTWHTCAVLVSGAARCWGSNAAGNLGNGTTTTATTPVAVSGLSSGVTTISAGSSYATCATLATGAVRCWGANGQGTLGNGTTTDAHLPVQVSGLTSGVASVSVGSWHSCGVTTTGGARCWGYNQFGGLGNGTTTRSLTPVTVIGGP